MVLMMAICLQQLYGMGARRIGVTSPPPLGCLPASITLFGHGGGGCVERLNRDAQSFNRKMNATVVALSSRYPDLKIAVFDIYTPLYDLATNPQAQGFTEARRGCCGTGTVETTVLLCNPKSGARAPTPRPTCSGTPSTRRRRPTKSSPTRSSPRASSSSREPLARSPELLLLHLFVCKAVSLDETGYIIVRIL